MTAAGFQCGFVAIVGRPNVGKSTLMNRLIEQKISITSRKAQTTRHRIHGIRTDDDCQCVFVDTPGFQTRHSNAMHQVMNRTVVQSVQDVDVVVWVIEALQCTPADEKVLRFLPPDAKVVLVINKIDRIKDRDRLLPFLEQMSTKREFHAMVPVSAQQGSGIDALLGVLKATLPEGPPMFEPDQITDRSERFLAAELIREKVFRLLGEELPYAAGVLIDKFEEEGGLRRIFATILVERDGHKAIVIGQGGSKLKQIGSEARQDMEQLFDGKVYLELWVKVRAGWSDNLRLLREQGIE